MFVSMREGCSRVVKEAESECEPIQTHEWCLGEERPRCIDGRAESKQR